MHPTLRALSQCRPRVLTLVALVLVAASIVLSNLSCDRRSSGHFYCQSYGWPLIWHRYVLLGFGHATIGWYYSAGRLAANLAMWLLALATTGGACEWLLRRYRPRLRWSLRTMLAAVALLAVLCAWFVNARERARLQDPLIAAMPGGWTGPQAGVERWGPIWLDLFGADRFCRHIVCASLSATGDEGADETRIQCLA